MKDITLHRLPRVRGGLREILVCLLDYRDLKQKALRPRVLSSIVQKSMFRSQKSDVLRTCIKVALLYFVVTSATATAGNAQTREADSADEDKILRCIENSEKLRTSGKSVGLECVGKVSDACVAAGTEAYALRAALCYSEERILWDRILRKAFNSLVSQLASIDEMRKLSGIAAQVPSLMLAHELWEKSLAADCDFILQSNVEGTARSDASEYCKLVLTARRTYFYRNPSYP